MTASPDSTEDVDLLSEDESLWAVVEVILSGSEDESLWAMEVVTLSASSALMLLFSDMVVLLMIRVFVKVFGNLSRQLA